MAATTHYDTLGVSATATAEQIRSAYRRLAKQLHPDASRLPDAQQRFAAIATAYEVLSDRDKRRAYDAELAAPRAGAPGPNGRVDRRAHYTWSNIATHGADAARAENEATELDELYDTFFGGAKPARKPASKAQKKRGKPPT